MYKKAPKGWLKHIDFIIIDCICLQLAFLFGYWARHGMGSPYRGEVYGKMQVMLTFFDLFIAFLCESYKSILKRDQYKELIAVFKHTIYLFFMGTFYLFMLKEGDSYSRGAFGWMVLFFIFLSYPSRLLWKKYLKSRRNITSGKSSLVIITSSNQAQEVIDNIVKYNFKGLKVNGVALLDVSRIGESIGSLPIIADGTNIVDYISREWVDEVFISLPKDMEVPQKLIQDCYEMGVILHMELATIRYIKGQKQVVERMGNYAVLTTCMNVASVRQMFYKRMIDICGGFVGCLVTAFLVLIFGPLIYIKSPGPIFFAQTRVGKNGKKFKLYKFRSMYLDAEERKAELIKQNKIKDGMMFKMDKDPRIIGGENGKGIGNFIRNTSIDEWPQFWNVLKGDMSLVGTRPPTVDEWEKYQPHHRARLSIKPGITGLWQVSGRSEITDFEQVVELDTEYIENWNFLLDLKILCKTVQVVLLGKGAS